MAKFYLVEFELPKTILTDSFDLIVRQRAKINQLMLDGNIRAYSISSKRSRLWIIAEALSEFEVMKLISQFPLNEVMIPTIHPLEFHEQSVPHATAV